MAWQVDIEEENGDLVDILYYCSSSCVPLAEKEYAYRAMPFETDYDVYCATCVDLIQSGLQSHVEQE